MYLRSDLSDAFAAKLLRSKGLDGATRWMMTPHPMPDNLSPDQACAAGRDDEVEQLIDEEEHPSTDSHPSQDSAAP